jgi:hypothetical protein
MKYIFCIYGPDPTDFISISFGDIYDEICMSIKYGLPNTKMKHDSLILMIRL